MNYFVAIPFIAVIVNLVFTTYIFAQNRKDPVNEAYILLSAFFIGWMFFDIIHWSPINPDWIVPLLRIQSFFWLLVGFMFTHFTYTFLGRQRDIPYYLILTSSMASVPLGLSSDLVIKGYVSEIWGTAIEPGTFYVPMVSIVVLLPFVYSLALFARRMLMTKKETEKNQCRLVLYGTGVAVALTFLTIIILPHFLDFPALPQTHMAIMIHLLFVFLAIVKYKFLAVSIGDAAQDIFSSVKDGVVLLGKENEVIQINNSARKIFGLQSEDEPQSAVDNFLINNIGHREINEDETELELDGYNKTLRVSRSPLKQSGQDVGSILFIRDITARKHAEYEVSRINNDLARARDEALAASKAKSQFLANMSHELRTPLNAIIGYSEMLRDETADAGNQLLSSDLGKINSAGHHLLSLINDILDLSKIEAGRMDLFPEEVDVDILVKEIEEVIGPLVDKNSNRLIIQGARAAGVITSDITKLRQILINLLSNAAKFTTGGEVRLNVERQESTICFTVSDTGIGMSPDQVEKLFENFSQADASTTRKYGGTGLGLAISQRFCELMGGNIRVSSQEGNGSEFEICLPLRIKIGDDAKLVDSAKPDSERKKDRDREGVLVSTPLGKLGRSSQTVLLIDDDPAVRDILSRYLCAEGCNVLEAADGETGIRAARENLPDIIILDVMMPGTDGWTVLEKLKAVPELAAIPVIMLTMVEDRSQGYALGAMNFLSKPLDWPLMRGIIRDTLGVPSSNSGPILVIDDDIQNRELIRFSLEREGWQVNEAENGKIALQSARENRPDLILLDLMMPEMDGFEFVDEIRRFPECRNIPILVLTAMDIDEKSLDRLRGRVEEIFVKGSYNKQALLEQIKEIITGQEQLNQAARDQSR